MLVETFLEARIHCADTVGHRDREALLAIIIPYTNLSATASVVHAITQHVILHGSEQRKYASDACVSGLRQRI